MAVTPWREGIAQSYVGAAKWGTGINPVHSKRYGDNDVGRNLAPGPYNSEPLERSGIVAYDFGYTDEDMDSVIGDTDIADHSYMSAHPGLGDERQRGDMGAYPSWGYGGQPGPQGLGVRALKRGMAWKEQIPLQNPRNSATEGWTNKEHGPIMDARVSDQSQLYIQTSMRQRDEIRVNTAAQTRRTDDARSDIASRITGVKIKNYSGGIRHSDMTPKTQDGPFRPWLTRTAGTGPVGWNEANEWVTTEPIQRTIPQDTYSGPGEDEVAGPQSEMYDEWSSDGW